MKRVSLLLLSVLMSACGVATCPEKPAEDGGQQVTQPQQSEQPASLDLRDIPADVDGVLANGGVVCRKQEDLRSIEIQDVEGGKCLLRYNNHQSGSGTQNLLSSRAACELQQQRMKENFLRSGFACN